MQPDVFVTKEDYEELEREDMKALESALIKIFPKVGSVEKSYLKVKKIDNNSFEFLYGKMYEAPEVNFHHLKQLSDLFGTDNINVNNYNCAGCETCDYGSDYQNAIQIKNITKNLEGLRNLVGTIYE